MPNTEEKLSALVQPFTHGGYNLNSTGFDEAFFNAHWHPIYFVVFSFIRRFNRRDLHVMHDPVAAMIASEIWLYNIGRLLARKDENGLQNLSHNLRSEEHRRRVLPKCNTYSIAQYFGLPYQTVRRKVMQLVESGFLEKSDNGELMVTAAAEAGFTQEFNLETMRDFISTARCVFDMLGIEHRIGSASSEAVSPAAAPASRQE